MSDETRRLADELANSQWVSVDDLIGSPEDIAAIRSEVEARTAKAMAEERAKAMNAPPVLPAMNRHQRRAVAAKAGRR